MSDIGLIILAAGGSTRMGRPKQLLPFANETLLSHAAKVAVNSGCRPVIVVLGASADLAAGQLPHDEVEIATNLDWEKGVGTSIRAGVRHLLKRPKPPQVAVIMLADQPLVSSVMLQGLLAAHAAGGSSVTVSDYGDAIGPPVVVNAEHFPQLLRLGDDQGAKALWLEHPQRVRRYSCVEAGMDIDTPQDYARLKSALSNDV